MVYERAPGIRLKISEIQTILERPKIQNEGSDFIKDPCLTYLVTFKADSDLNKLQKDGKHLLRHQPYLFAVKLTLENKISHLFELQIFAQKSQLIGKWENGKLNLLQDKIDVFARRSDFNGAKIRLTLSPYNSEYFLDENGKMYGRMADLLSIFQKKFNFQIELVPFKGYGLKQEDGSFTGVFGQIHRKEIDFGKN